MEQYLTPEKGSWPTFPPSWGLGILGYDLFMYPCH